MRLARTGIVLLAVSVRRAGRDEAGLVGVDHGSDAGRVVELLVGRDDELVSMQSCGARLCWLERTRAVEKAARLRSAFWLRILARQATR
jgi:hypothetical protein